MKRSRDSEDEGDSLSPDQQDIATVPVPKIVGLDNEDEDGETTTTNIQCSMPGHAPGLSFTSYSDYEAHYNNAHTNRCLECRKNFPSSYFLDLHIAEYHDALLEIKKENGELIHACFVEACAEKFKTQGKRQDHLVKTHMFPANYFFAVTKFGIDRRQSMLVEYRKKGGKQQNGSNPQERKAKNNTEESTATDAGAGETEATKDIPMTESQELASKQEVAVDAAMEDLTGAMSSLKFIPRTVRLGPRQRAGFARR